jgi:outer membrane protein TolC
MLKNLLITIFLLCLLMFKVSGQPEVRMLTLEDVIRLAQEQSPDALEARQTFRSSYWDYRGFLASRLPALTFTSTLPYYNQSITSQMVNGVQSYSSYHIINASANLELRQKIGLTGGSLKVNSSLSGQYNYNQANPLPYLSKPINIELEQPLFTFNASRWDRKIKPLKYSIAKRKYLEQIEDISLQATFRFFNLLLAQVEKKIAEINLSNYDTLYRIGKGRYQLGKIAENDLLQLELSLLKAQLQMENSNLALDNAQFRFKSYLRIQDNTRIVLLPPAMTSFPKIDPSSAINYALEQSSTALDFQRRLMEGARVNQAKLTGRFDASVYALVGLNKNAETVPDAYRKPGDDRQFSLGLTIPIYDWGVARGNIKVAQAQMEITRNAVQQDSIDFRQNVYLKAIEFNMQTNQLLIAAKSDTVAKKSYEVTKGRYLIGKLNSIIDLNTAQTDKDQSQKNYYTALETFWRSYFEIRKLTLFDFLQNKPIEFNFTDFK